MCDTAVFLILLSLNCFDFPVFEMRIANQAIKDTFVEAGRLEVRLTSLMPWGSVCDDGFDIDAALSACRYMGYKYGEVCEHQSLYGYTNIFMEITYHLDNVFTIFTLS